MGVFAAGKYVEDCKFLLDQIDELQAWKDSVLAGIRKASADRAAERQASRHLRMDVAEKRLAMREAAE